jgi:acetyl esterase/lipase
MGLEFIAEIVGPGRRPLHADVFRPEPDVSLRTAVILLHGGAWRFGSRADVVPYAKLLARHGFVAVAAEYRLLGEAAFPAQLDDVRDVIAWVRAQADHLEIDPAKIAVQGYSAGGHLALLAAAGTAQGDAPPVAAVIAFFAPPVLDLPPPPGMPPLSVMLLGPAASAAAVAAATPLAQVTAGFPPTFLLGGMQDFLVPPAVTLRLFDALVAAHVDVELHLYHGHTHEFAALPSMLEPVQAEVALFLRRSVVDPEGYRDENLALNPFARPGSLPPPPREAHTAERGTVLDTH